MQKPDENGFVTINWPSKNVPHGGIFHNHIANPTQDQQHFLKVLLEESKLTITQNQKNAWALRQGREKKQQPQKQTHGARTQLVRPRTSRRRSFSEIRSSGVFDFDKYQPPKRGEDRDLMIERFANTMTYGDKQEQKQVEQPNILLKPKVVKLPTNKEKWNDLVTQIRERTEWLAEMEYLGHGGPHRDIIKDQIAERMRALDELGIDSVCSSARSIKSGFSTVKSTELAAKPIPASATYSDHSSRLSDISGKNKKQSVRGSVRARNKDENVESYAALSPLQRTPRRRQ